MSHHAISDYGNANFRIYTALLPSGPASRPASGMAFDAMPRGLARRQPVTSDFERGGVFDFIRKMARDAKAALDDEDDPEVAPAAGKSVSAKQLSYLAGKLEPEDWAALQEHLGAHWGAKMSPEDWAALQTVIVGPAEVAADEPPPFSGRPRPGGEQDPVVASTVRTAAPAMDSAAAKSFFDRFPDARRLGVDRYPRDPNYAQARRTVAPTSRDVARFEEMFPEAARVRVGR